MEEGKVEKIYLEREIFTFICGKGMAIAGARGAD